MWRKLALLVIAALPSAAFAQPPAPAAKPSPAEVLAAAKQGCEAGRAPYCLAVANLTLGANRANPDIAGAMPWALKACTLGALQACQFVETVADSKPQLVDRAAMSAAFVGACGTAEGTFCEKASTAVLAEARTAADLARAATFTDRGCAKWPGSKICDGVEALRGADRHFEACRAGRNDGCAGFAAAITRYDRDVGLRLSAPVRARALTDARAACRSGNQTGCAADSALGQTLKDDGAALQRQMVQAHTACAARDRLGCEIAGGFAIMSYDVALNTMRDLNDRYADGDAAWRTFNQYWVTAKRSLSVGCELNWAPACAAIALRSPMHETSSTPVDARWRAVCAKESARRCFQIGSLLPLARFTRGEYGDTLGGKFGCATAEVACIALGRWYGGTAATSANSPYANAPYLKAALAMIDEACTRGSADACVWMMIYSDPTDPNAVKERGKNPAAAQAYARKALAIDPTNTYARGRAAPAG